MVKDVSEADFAEQVIERSKQVPVVVDFWAEWCGPCRTRGPAIEQAVNDRGGEVELAKVDVDQNQQLASAFRVQGIPAVKAFRNGEVVDEFTGALPPAKINEFLDRIVPSEAEELARAAVESGDEESLRAALEADPGNVDATAALARLMLAGGKTEEASALVEPLAATDFILAGLHTRAQLVISGDAPIEAFEAWDAGDHEFAMELLLKVAGTSDADRQDLIRKVMVGWFTELGPASELSSAYRRRLAAILS